MRSNGLVDPNLCSNLQTNRQAGIQPQVYLTPCFSCGNPYKQYQDLSDYMEGCLGSYARHIEVRLVVEGLELGSKLDNQKFISDLVQTIHDYEGSCMILTSKYDWDNIVGEDFTQLSSICWVWYVHLDNYPGFQDFVPFAGWKSPSLKQYSQNVQMCNLTVNLDYFGPLEKNIINDK